MKPTHAHLAITFCCVVFFSLAPAGWAQKPAAAKRTGYPQDWSQHHIVFSRDGLAQHPELVYQEPRVLQQVLQRWQMPHYGTFESLEPTVSAASVSSDHKKKRKHVRDWSYNLPGHTAFNTFPAKFSFFPDAAPSCTTDYVVFGLTNSPGAGVAGGNANLVGFNNLYVNAGGTGLCAPLTSPTPLFAYNITTVTGGHILTSPILSLDGTEIAFIESVPANAGMGITAQSWFHALTWTANAGTPNSAAVPGAAMTSVQVSLGASNTHSSPWIDYAKDIVYVGSDDGYVHRILNAFSATPTLDGGVWPVLVTPNLHLTAPVLDQRRGYLMVGSANGSLYQIDTTSGALGVLPIGALSSSGIVAPPVVDVANGTTFAVTANDGAGAAVLAQVDTASVLLDSEVEIGVGASTGTTMNLYEPAFNNNYFESPATGLVRICGTSPANTSPYQYAIGFTGTTMHASPEFSAALTPDSTAARCTGWTEFYNPNIGGGTDYFFFGLTQDCTTPGAGAPDGCVAEITDAAPGTVTEDTIIGGPSGIVLDNYSSGAEASSIYFTAWKTQVAYKLTQNGLH